MNKLALVVVGVVTCLEMSTVVAQERIRAPRDFTRTVDVETRHGTAQRVIEQRVLENGVNRSSVTTLSDGRTATREALITRDREAGTMRKEIEGSRFNGDTYSGVVERVRTDSGYTSDAVVTNAAGAQATRTVVATIDEATGTVTKQITRVDFDGDESTREVVVDRADTPREFEAAIE